MDSSDNAAKDSAMHSFSIRNFVLRAREQDIHNNWPFLEKYLEVCVNCGIKKLLPPFESLDSVRCSLYKENVQYGGAQEENAHIASENYACVEIKKEKELAEIGTNICINEAVSEITMQMSPLSLSSNKYKHDEGGVNSEIVLHQFDTKVATSTFGSSFACQTDQYISTMPPTKTKKQKRKGKQKKRWIAEIYAEAKPSILEDFAYNSNLILASTSSMRSYVCDQGALEV